LNSFENAVPDIGRFPEFMKEVDPLSNETV
jgi:hypothetical protein